MNNKSKGIGNMRKQITSQKKRNDKKALKPPVNTEKRSYEVKVWRYNYDLVD